MGIFGSKSPGEGVAATRPSQNPTSLSVIGAGMTVRGDIETPGVIKVEGVVDGHVKADHQVLVAKGGVVRGDVETREAVVGGTVTGSITASERVDVQVGASVQGDIITRRIVVAEGATLNGQIRMGDAVDRPAAKPSRQAPPPVPAVSRPSVPIARVAVSPRAAGQGTTNNH